MTNEGTSFKYPKSRDIKIAYCAVNKSEISIICALLHYFLDSPNAQLIITYNMYNKK